MAVGTQQDANSVNAWAGDIALGLERIMTEIQHFKAFLDATPDTTLEAAPYSLSANDVATLKSALTDAANLAAVYYGTGIQATAYNFSGQFLKQLRGTSCW